MFWVCLADQSRTAQRGVAVFQIEQRFNLPATKAYASLLEGLRRRNIPTSVVNENQGLIQTKPIAVQDRMCENGIVSSAPVACRVRLFFSVHALSPVATSLTSRYRETCNFNEDILVECPNSNAEQLLKEVTQEAAIK